MTPYIFLQLVGPYAAIALVFGLSLYLLYRVRIEVGRVERQEETARAATLAEIRQAMKVMEDSVASLRTDLQAAEEQFRLSAGAPVKSWNNINKRTQVLKRLRAGDTPQRIAAELDMSSGEVDLIVKVNSLTGNHSTFPISA